MTNKIREYISDLLKYVETSNPVAPPPAKPTKTGMSVLLAMRDGHTIIYREIRKSRNDRRKGDRRIWSSFRYYPWIGRRTMNRLEKDGHVTHRVTKDEPPREIEGVYEITDEGKRAVKMYLQLKW